MTGQKRISWPSINREKLRLYAKNLRAFWAQFRKSRGGMMGLGILILFILMAVLAPVLSTVKDPNDTAFSEKNYPAGSWATNATIEAQAENASHPQIAVDDLGNAIAVWEASSGAGGSISSNRYVVGTGWGEAVSIGVISAGYVGSPQVAVNSTGSASAVWEQSDGLRSRVMVSNYDLVFGWSDPEALEITSGVNASAPQIAMSPAGDAIAVWERSNQTDSVIAASVFDIINGWSAPERISDNGVGDTSNPQIAIDRLGNAIAVWEQYDSPRHAIWASRHVPSRGWGDPVLVANRDTGDAHNARIALNRSGSGVVVWEQANGSRSDIWANQYAVEDGWNASGPIEAYVSGSAQNPQIAFYRESDAIAVWQQSDGTRNAIWSNRYVQGTGWGTPTLVEASSAADLTNPRLSARESGIAVAVWERAEGSLLNISSKRYSRTGWGNFQTLMAMEGTADTGPSVAIDPGNYAFAVWERSDGIRTDILASRDYGNGWMNPHAPSLQPSPESGLIHPLGTDFMGKDVYSMMLYGAIASLVVGVLASLISLILGTGIGVGAGFAGGLPDEILMRLTDFFLVIPWFPLAIVISFVLGPGFVNVIIVIGIVSWPSTARIVRAQVLSVKERGFVQRARCVGAGTFTIIRRHIMPNIMPLIFANTVLLVANSIFMEAFLDFFGFGDPDVISWGLMLEEAYSFGGFSAMYYWWPILPPGACIVALVMAFYMIGDAIDDIVNPKLRRR